MKKRIMVWFVFLCILLLMGCNGAPTGPVNTVRGNLKTYQEMADGTWQADGHTYKHRLEVSGTLPNAQASTTFVYLSNLETISFEQAWRATGLSSNLDDYFSVEEAMLVEMITSK